MIKPLRWNTNDHTLALLDQTKLPLSEEWLRIADVPTLAEAIRSLRVRGAPAIGIAAAYGVALAVRPSNKHHSPSQGALDAIEVLARTRPTAVNLFWALNRMRSVVSRHVETDQTTLFTRLLDEAHSIEDEDEEAGRQIGEYGLTLLRDGMSVLTHCHAGGVATSGYGTALAPLHLARERNWRLHVYVDETRPLLQGSRITAWELQRSDIPLSLITDSMAGHVMQQNRVDAVIVGADRVAANGDVANKIGTYTLAVLADAHGIPFYVAMPLSTIDPATPTGSDIVIEEREASEVTRPFGRQTAPEAVGVYNPAFDVTPARLVTAFVTERGVVHPPFGVAFAKMLD